jgi:hypothetical protein
LERAETTEPSGYITKLFDDTGVENAIQMAFIKQQIMKAGRNINITTIKLTATMIN